MTDDIKLWEIDASSKVAQPAQAPDQAMKERTLEDLLVGNPEILMPGLEMVGRQLPINNGNLDLLGVDRDGQLVVFEIKRDNASRSAVAQVIDYCSYLDTLEINQLSELITNNSGTKGINKIDDFAEWYRERLEMELTSAPEIKMVLVVFGADTGVKRMVGYLMERGVSICLMTLHEYKFGDRTFLARKTDSAQEHTFPSERKQSNAERRRTHAKRAAELGIGGLWQDAVKALSITSDGGATRSGITFFLRRITLPDNVNAAGSYSVVIDEKLRMIRITFYPASVDICLEKFQKLKETIPFICEKPSNTPSTKRVNQQWGCLLDDEKWETHKAALTELAHNVCNAWQKRCTDQAGK